MSVNHGPSEPHRFGMSFALGGIWRTKVHGRWQRTYFENQKTAQEKK